MAEKKVSGKAAEGIGTLLAAVTSLVFDTGPGDDDAVDRLNHVIMYGLLLVLAVATGSKQFVGAPINCWLPAEYKEKFQKLYVNNHCWVNSLYNIPFDETVPVEAEKRYTNDVTFYRWVTVLFITLAFLFRVPRLLWNELRNFSGVNVEKLVGMTTDTVLLDQTERDKKLGYVAEFLHRWITTRSKNHGPGRCHFLQSALTNTVFCYGKRSGHNLIFIYIFIKFIYLLNTLVQFFIISSVLKINFWTFGLDVVRDLTQEGRWENNDVFPRVALCDMKIRQLQNVNTYTVQCVLNVNLFIEKMFLIFWFCLGFMLIANAISFSRWVYELLSQDQTMKFLDSVSGDLVPGTLSDQRERKMVLDMIAKYMKPDGIFILRLIAKNTSDMLTVDLVQQIWKRNKKFISGSGSRDGFGGSVGGGMGSSLGRGCS